MGIGTVGTETALREYQARAVTQIRNLYRRGVKKVLLQMSTGGGKTVVFSHILQETIRKGTPCLMVVRGRKLVDQAAQRLRREGVEIGIHMAGREEEGDALIKICSIDTLRSRDLYPKADFIVIDEVHMAVSDSYINFLAHYPNAFVLGVTATPYSEKTLRHAATEIVRPVTAKDLIGQGFLVKGKYFAPSVPNLKDVQISASTHDYVQNQLEGVMTSEKLSCDIVEHWKKLAVDRPTLCFAVTVRHSKFLVDRFNEAGIPAEHCDADTPDEEREWVIRRLENGTTKIVSNVGIFCTGVDIPCVSCIVMARPTKSYILYMQQLGRATRPFPDKDHFLVLDHADNVRQHDYYEEEPLGWLDATKDEKRHVSSVKICKKCFMAYQSTSCPVCGPEEVKTKPMMERAGELVELSQADEIKQYIAQLKELVKKNGWRRGYIYYKLKDKYGEEIAQKYFKRKEVPIWVLQNIKLKR